MPRRRKRRRRGLPRVGRRRSARGVGLGLAPRLLGVPVIFNLPAVLIVAVITWVLVRGIRESAVSTPRWCFSSWRWSSFFVGVGACYVKPANWRPFAPNGLAASPALPRSSSSPISALTPSRPTAEETRNPQRDLPIGIIASLVVCTVVYVAGCARPDRHGALEAYSGVADPLAMAFSHRGLELGGRHHLVRRGVCHHLRAACFSAGPASHPVFHGP